MACMDLSDISLTEDSPDDLMAALGAKLAHCRQVKEHMILPQYMPDAEESLLSLIPEIDFEPLSPLSVPSTGMDKVYAGLSKSPPGLAISGLPDRAIPDEWNSANVPSSISNRAPETSSPICGHHSQRHHGRGIFEYLHKVRNIPHKQTSPNSTKPAIGMSTVGPNARLYHQQDLCFPPEFDCGPDPFAGTTTEYAQSDPGPSYIALRSELDFGLNQPTITLAPGERNHQARSVSPDSWRPRATIRPRRRLWRSRSFDVKREYPGFKPLSVRQAAARAHPSKHLLAQPQEIRDLIYSFNLTQAERIPLNKVRVPKLFVVNKQIREEATPIFYAVNKYTATIRMSHSYMQALDPVRHHKAYTASQICPEQVAHLKQQKFADFFATDIHLDIIDKDVEHFAGIDIVVAKRGAGSVKVECKGGPEPIAEVEAWMCLKMKSVIEPRIWKMMAREGFRGLTLHDLRKLAHRIVVPYKQDETEDADEDEMDVD